MARKILGTKWGRRQLDDTNDNFEEIYKGEFLEDGALPGSVLEEGSVDTPILKKGSVTSDKLGENSVTKNKIAFNPYNRLNFKRANFNTEEFCDFDENGNYTFKNDGEGQIPHNYKIYSDQSGLGQAVKVCAKHTTVTDSTRVFLGLNDAEMIFINARQDSGYVNLEIHSVEKNNLKANVFPFVKNIADAKELTEDHSITLRQYGYFLGIYFNDNLVHYINSKTYFSTQFTFSGAAFRGSLSGNSHVKTINCEESRSPYMHMSIDDVNSVLRDLNDNRGTYSSIFDNSNLAFLKSLNDKYGAVFSLYLFKETSSFDISNMTTKYRTEFAENSHWLKLGFHSKKSGVNYLESTVDEALKDYESVVDSIYKFAVSSTLDTIPRFENFGMSLECQRALVSAGLPFEGTYGADDNRALSAGLTGMPLTIIQNTDYYFDPGIQLFYPRSEYRLDSATEDTVLKQLEKLGRDVANNRIFGMFWHQGAELREEQQKAIEAACKWAVNHQVRFDFPQNNKPSI